MAVMKYCEPIIVTLPGSVLLAEAAIEKMPRPNIASVPAPTTKPDDEGVEAGFDSKYATISDEERTDR